MAENFHVPLDAALYRETLARLELRAVRLLELETRCHHAVAGNARINIATEANSRQEKGELLIDAQYTIKAANETNELFTIKATFVVALTAPDELPEGFVDIYIANNLSLTVFPYVRELVASLTSRMGLPALTLPYVLNQYEKPPAKPKPRARKKKVAD